MSGGPKGAKRPLEPTLAFDRKVVGSTIVAQALADTSVLERVKAEDTTHELSVRRTNVDHAVAYCGNREA